MIDTDLIRDRLLKEVLNDSYPDEMRSVLLYQAGQIIELSGGESADALRHYLLALKLEDDCPLPLLATGSILLGASSYQRLNKLLAMALERTTGRLQGVFKLLLAEHLASAPVEGFDKLELLTEVSNQDVDRVLALALLEVEYLVSGDTSARAEVLESWIASTTQPMIAAQLKLDLADLRLTGDDPEGARAAIDGLLEEVTPVFPILSEVVRVGIESGDCTATCVALLKEAASLASRQEVSQEEIAHRFIIAEPTDRAGAAAALTLLAWQLLAQTPGSRRDESVVTALDAVISSIEPERLVACGLDGIVTDHYLASGRFDDLDEYLRAVAGQESAMDRAWALWSRARSALTRGDFESVSARLTEIRELGLDSRVIDALQALGGQAGEIAHGSSAADRVGTLIALDAKWSMDADHGALARELASLDEMNEGVADLAWVVSRLSGDSFLRDQALKVYASKEGPRNALALLDRVRLHGFEHPSCDGIVEALGSVEGGSSAAVHTAVLAALGTIGDGDRPAIVVDGLVDLTRSALGEADELTARRLVSFPAGVSAQDEAIDSGPLGVHAMLAQAADEQSAPALASRLSEALESQTALPIEIASSVARRLLETAPDQEAVRALVGRLVEPDSGIDSASRLLLSMMIGSSEKMLEALVELGGELEPGPTSAALHLIGAMRVLVEDGDAAAVLDAATSALQDDPDNVEAVSLFALMAPAAGRFEDLSVALSRLLEGGGTDDPVLNALRRTQMLVTLVKDRDVQAACEQADGVLQARGGDPLALIVRMAAAGATKDLAGYTRELQRLSLWFGDPVVKGKLAHHQHQLMVMTPSGALDEDALPPPDVANLPNALAPAVLNGPMDLTDSGLEGALVDIRGLQSAPHKVRALVELAELVEAAGQPSRALELFGEALDCDGSEPGAVEGLMRLGAALDDHTALARGCEARASMTSDTSRAVTLLNRAAESYAHDKSSAEAAARCYTRAAELDPTDPHSFTGLVKAMELRGDIEALIDLLERRVASVMEPEEIEVLQLKLADLKRKIKDHEGALLALDDLLLVQPGKVTAWKMKLDLLLHLQQFDKALVAADSLLTHLRDRESKVAVLQKCISISLTRLKDLEAGLKYCLMLVREGEAEQDLINKTMRLALRLERWDEAAALQQDLAMGAETPRERLAMLLKKAEIHLRYAKDPQAAEAVYLEVLEQAPLTWDALARWNASRGAEGLSIEEVTPQLQRVKDLLIQQPLRLDALTFLVKAYRMLRQPGAARHYDSIRQLISDPDNDAKGVGQRVSLTSMLPELPSGRLPDEERDEMLGAHGASALAVGVIGNLCRGGGTEVLARLGAIPAEIEASPMEAALPVARQLGAWAESFGIARLELCSADDVPDEIRLGEGPRLVLDSTFGHTIPETVQFRAGALIGSLALGCDVATLMVPDRLEEFVKAGLMAVDVDASELQPEESTAEIAEAIREGCTAGCFSRLASLAEVAPRVDAEAIHEGVASMMLGLTRAGILVSGSVWGMIVYHHPSFAEREDVTAQEIREFVETSELLAEGIKFALSDEFGRLRQALGLQY